MRKMNDKLFGIIGTVVFFGVVIGYFTEFKYIDNTLHVGKLLLYSALIGLICGFLVALLTNSDPPNSVEKTRNYLFVIMAFTIAMPVVGLKSNRWFATNTTEIVPFTFIKQKPVLAKPFGQMKFESNDPTYYLVYLTYNGENIKIKTKKPLVKNDQSGKEVYLPVKSGLWGFKIVDTKALSLDEDTI